MSDSLSPQNGVDFGHYTSPFAGDDSVAGVGEGPTSNSEVDLQEWPTSTPLASSEREIDDDEFGEFMRNGQDASNADLEMPGKERYEEQLADILESPTKDNVVSSQLRAGSIAVPKSFKRANLEFAPVASTSGASSPTPSSDTFPALPLTKQQNVNGSPSSSLNQYQRPAYHPQVSRLRSISKQDAQHRRFVSSSSYSTALERPPASQSSIASFADHTGSRRSSASNLYELTLKSDLPTPNTSSSPAATSTGEPPPSKVFKFSSLKRISSRIYPPNSSKQGVLPNLVTGSMGLPSVIAVSGVVAVGTSKGWVMVFDFSQNLKCVCGTEAITKDAGPVTALAISQDHTFIAVGHASGSINLYTLSKPTQPARSVYPTTLPLVLTGRKEGHLIGSRILQIGFVGARHTAIISSDDKGLAFYHSLGKILMLASTDIIRMLGRYPDASSTSVASSPPLGRVPVKTSVLSTVPESSPSIRPPEDLGSGTSTPKNKRPADILSMSALPLGPVPHSSDSHALVALLTPTKLVIVGLKPSPRTWWRATPVKGDVETNHKDYSTNGVLSWYPSSVLEDLSNRSQGENGHSNQNGTAMIDGSGQGEDPVLAFCWGRKVRFVRVKRDGRRAGVDPEKEAAKISTVDFVESEGWVCDSPVLSLQWYNQRILLLLCSNYVEIYDTELRQRLGRDHLDTSQLVSSPHNDVMSDLLSVQGDNLAYSCSFKCHKRKLFLLTNTDIRAGAILTWADRILALMQPGTILDAIDVTTSYLLGNVDASTITLPKNPNERRAIVEPKLREILDASLRFVFSEDRLRDGSHNDAATMQQLFSSLVGVCVRACLALNDPEWLFDELYERYEQNGIEGIFLERLEPFVLSGSVHALPPSVSQRLISIHDSRGQYDAAQRIIWRVDPESLDIDQALNLCQREKLYDALIHVYTRAMHDFVAPLVELLRIVRDIVRHRMHRPSRVGGIPDGGGDDEMSFVDNGEPNDTVESNFPDAYKVYAYLGMTWTGLSYPGKEELREDEAVKARNELYSFVFSKRTRRWPAKGGNVVLTSDEEGLAESPYPYLRLLLRFDAEAMLETLDLAFEDPYLGGDVPEKTITRQAIVDLLLKLMSDYSSDFNPIDRTFFNIFVARNLPKYPQFISLRPAVIHQVLVELAMDVDQSTTEDRQLAAEYLLSSYTPPDGNVMIQLFEQAGFFRILRSIYRGERKWAALALTYLRDPEIGANVFGFLRETLKLGSKSTGMQKDALALAILDAVPVLIQADETGLQQTAELFDCFLPTYHEEVVQRLSASTWRQFAYLRCLLEPSATDLAEDHPMEQDRTSSVNLGHSERMLYLELLCNHDPSHVVQYLEQSFGKDPIEDVVRTCEENEIFDALIWAIDRRGDTEAALQCMDDTLERQTDALVHAMVNDDEVEETDVSQFPLSPMSKVDKIIASIAAITKVAIHICSTRSARGGTAHLTEEDLWFRLLGSLVSTTQVIRGIFPAAPKASDRSSTHRKVSDASSLVIHEGDQPRLSGAALDTISTLLPNALSALVCSTSTRKVSFPNLIRRLIESNARSPAANRSYANFKAIVSSMMDSYVFEGDLLKITSKISSQDLFSFVETYKEKRDQGWRPESQHCDECGELIWEARGHHSPAMSRSASVSMVIETMGMTGRPPMKKRPSLKGKEVDWAISSNPQTSLQSLKPITGVTVSRDGRVWHTACHLESQATDA